MASSQRMWAKKSVSAFFLKTVWGGKRYRHGGSVGSNIPHYTFSST